MNKPILPSLLLALAATVAPAAGPKTITVVGQQDVGADRGAIQAAVDAAQPGDTVLLSGTFHLDGAPVVVETSRVTIAGEAIDDDGDGLANEDPVDGIDDDGDGLVDEDDWNTVLVGVDDGLGGPALDVFPDRFNDAFQILGFDADLTRIAFRDLAFEKVNRAIYLFPDYDDGGTVLLCDETVATDGSLDRVLVERNRFLNSFRGVEILGRVTDARIRQNLFRDLVGAGVQLFGTQIACAEADGSLVEVLPLGILDRTDIVDNRMINASFGVLSFISNKTSVRRNVMTGGLAGVASLDDTKMSVAHGEISGTTFGVLASRGGFGAEPGADNTVSHNLFSGNLWGVLVDCITTGYTLVNNEFGGSLLVDVQLDGTAPGGFCAGIGDSYENTVIATAFPTTVWDFGVDNKVIGGQPAN